MIKVTQALAACVVIAASSAGAVAQTLVGTPSAPAGVDNLVVDGRTYDVTFANGSFDQTFPNGLPFTSYGAGSDAAQDLANAFNMFGVSATAFGGAGGQCPDVCQLGIPFSVVDTANDNYSWLVQNGLSFNNWNVSPFPNGWAGDTAPPYSWAVFTRVPEPTTLGLMVLGLIGAGFASRKRRIRPGPEGHLDMLPRRTFAIRLSQQGAIAVVLTALSAAAHAADPAQEVATAATHAGFAAQASTIEQAHMHLHHTVNCLVGPKGSGFDPNEANPCQKLGDGAIPDTADATTKAKLTAALSKAQAGLKSNDLTAAKTAAAETQAKLK